MARSADLEFRIDANVTGIPAVQQVHSKLKSLEGQMTRSTRAVNQYGGSVTDAQRRTRRFAMGALQQAGFQIGDYAVQVANGTSKMQAFGQQGSQLLGIFGPIGALAGAAVAIFSAFSIAATRSGASVGEMGAALGVLQEPLSAVATKVASLRDMFGGSFKVMVQNIDTALIAVGLFAAYMGGKYVASLALASSATVTFTGVMYGLGVAVGRVKLLLMRFLPFAIFAGLAKIIELFLRAKKGAGGFGEALKLLGDLGAAAFTYLAKSLQKATLGMKISLEQFKLNFYEAISAIATKFDDFIVGFVSKWNDTVGEATEALKIDMGDWTVAGLIQPGIDRVKATIAGLESELDGLGAPSDDVKKAWEALKAAIAAGTSEVNLFGGVTDEATDSASKAVTRLTDKFKSLRDSIKSSMENAFMSMVDGTMSARDAFKSMARDIIKELYRVLVVQKLVAAISGFFGGNLMSGPGVGVGSRGNFMAPLAPRAMGGPVTAGKPYLVGEKRPELFIPSRNGTIKSDTSGGASIVINQNNTFGDGVSRGEINAMLPKIVETTKAAVFDAQRRSVTGRGY